MQLAVLEGSLSITVTGGLMSYCVRKLSFEAKKLPLLLTSSFVVIGATAAFGQENAQPDQSELPPLEVTAKKEKKKAAKKATSQPAQSAVDAQAASTTEPGTGTSRNGATKPGLNLDTPATTGSRLGLSPLETPASVEVIPGETIRERGQTSVNDAVTQNATGFTNAGEPGNGGTSLTVRGFSGHNSVMRLYDGTRLYFGNGTITFPFDTWSAERIEVLRGPASVMYGEGAIGGVINVVPKKPTDFFTHEAEVAYGTDNMRRFGLGSGGPINDRLSYRFDASGIQSDGWLKKEGDFSSIALSGALAYRATDDLKFTISHDHGDQNPLRYTGTPLVNGKILDSLRDKNYNVRDSKISYVDNWTQLKTEWSPTDWFELRNVAYRISSDRYWRNVEQFSFNDATQMIDRSDYVEIRHSTEQIGNRMDATFRSVLPGGMKNAFVAGFDVNRIDHGRDNNSPYAGSSEVDPFNPHLGNWADGGPSVFSLEYDTRTEQSGLFAENHLELSKELSVIAGIRLDRLNVDRTHLRGLPDVIERNSFEKDFSYTTWRAGAVYTPIPGLAFYGQYATAVDPVGTGLLSLNTYFSNFKPTTGRQIEVGVKNEFWGGRGEWTLAAYDIEKKDLISNDPFDPAAEPLQVGQQSSRGIELSVAIQLSETIRYEGNVAILKAQYDEFVEDANDYSGNRPINVPEQVMNHWLSWAFLPDWEARVGVQWVGSVYSDNENALKRPDFTVVNLGLDYHVDDKSTITLRGFNVFDEVYAVSGSDTEWQLAPPRSAELSYRIKY
jgi:iron complex outermembrane receptor protein